MTLATVGFVATVIIALALFALPALQRRALAGAGSLLALLVVLVVAAPAHAAEYRIEEEGSVRVAAGESVDGSVVLSGKTAVVEGDVDGDVIVAAERVEITGTVSGNVYGIGEDLRVSGTVGGNVHLAGADVEVDGRVDGSAYLAGQHVSVGTNGDVGREVFAAGQSVRIDGRVGRDAHFAGETMVVAGTVEGSVWGYGKQVSLGSGATVGGDLNVTVSAEDALDVAGGATVGGSRSIDVVPGDDTPDVLEIGTYLGLLARVIALGLLGFLLVTLFPALAPRAPETNLDILRQVGIGFVVLVATPIAALLVALTVIGIPMALVLGAAYAALLYLSTLVVAYVIVRRLWPARGERIAMWTALVLLALTLIFELPIVGPGLSFVAHVLGLGCLAAHLWGLYRSRGGKPSVA